MTEIKSGSSDLINYDKVKLLEYKSLCEYLEENLNRGPRSKDSMESEIESLRTRLRSLEEEKNNILNSRTYKFSLKLYRVVRPLMWWRK